MLVSVSLHAQHTPLHLNFFIIVTPQRQKVKRIVLKKHLNSKRFLTYLVRNTWYSQNNVLNNNLEKQQTALLLILHPQDRTLNKSSLDKTSKFKEIFYLSSTQYSVLTKHCTLKWPWKTTNFFIINAKPMRLHFKRTVFKQNVVIQRDFGPN